MWTLCRVTGRTLVHMIEACEAESDARELCEIKGSDTANALYLNMFVHE